MAETLAGGTIANLIVVLRVRDEARSRQVARVASDGTFPMPRVLTCVHECLEQRCTNLVRAAEVLVITLLLTGEQGVQRVVKIVVPLRIQAVPSPLALAHEARVIAVALGDHPEVAAELGRQLIHARGDRLEDVQGRGIDDRVHRVEAQPVERILAQPHLRVVQHEASNLIRILTVEIERAAPRRLISVGEIGSECGEIVPLRADVVVNDVEDRRDAAGMAGIDKAMECLRSTVCAVRREEVDAVVSPASPAWELRDRHELDRIETQVHEVIEPRDRGVERAFRSEGADVELVDDRFAERKPAPFVAVPAARVLDKSRSPMDAVRLPPRARIGHRLTAVDGERVVVTGIEVGIGREPATSRLLHRAGAVIGDECDALRDRRPDTDPAAGHARSRRATGASSSNVARR